MKKKRLKQVIKQQAEQIDAWHHWARFLCEKRLNVGRDVFHPCAPSSHYTMIELTSTNETRFRAVTVHASAGGQAIEAVVAEKQHYKVFAVTVLTSLDSDAVHYIYGNSPEAAAINLADSALYAGADGVVCRSMAPLSESRSTAS